MESARLIFLTQFAATAMMTGIIWFVQIVHYPLFLRIPPEGFVAYEQLHTVRTGSVVAPLMLLELGTALLPLLLRLPGATHPLYLAAVGVLLLVWASTFLVQVPLHRLLSTRPDTAAMLLLVTTNWIRTLLWTLRLGLLGTFLLRHPDYL